MLSLTSHIQAEGDNVGIEHGQVKRGDKEVKISQHDSHGAVDDAIIAIDVALRLVRVASVVTRQGQRRVGQVQLRTPGHELRLTSSCCRDVGVVRSDALTWRFPFEEDLLARV